LLAPVYFTQQKSLGITGHYGDRYYGDRILIDYGDMMRIASIAQIVTLATYFPQSEDS
jgi:hypothetical protein